ncbi:MAG: hypothetical protein JWQ11_2396 [Rhizobacter sp.]|nr:hypothetical protein [Rhizobacter sp.]
MDRHRFAHQEPALADDSTPVTQTAAEGAEVDLLERDSPELESLDGSADEDGESLESATPSSDAEPVAAAASAPPGPH